MNNKQEGVIMDKLKVLGVSALCGSLAAISAQAGEMSVKGSANATYTSKEKAVTGQPLGMTTGLTFTGTGELDNGNTFTVNIAHDDQNTWSAADISVDIAGVGKITFDQGGGTGLDRLDDKMPTAWEESFDAGLGSNIVTATGVGGGTDIELAVDSGMLPDGVAVYLSYAPKATGDKVNDKATSGVTTDGVNHGWDVVVEHGTLMDGLNVFAGVSHIDQSDSVDNDDRDSYVIGGTYAIGSVTLGYQYYKDSMGRTSIDMYENHAYGLSFAVNDDLSISYGVHESDQDNGTEGSTVSLETSSLQAAYSMGGATFKLARSSVDNASYSTATSNDYDVNTFAISLAF
tara:strand:+ start:7696 stop:8730 length:1035 start_codon:yes stop_codon:yes gene_type:complete